MSSRRKSNTHTYGAARVELFLFYQTSVLSKTWCPSSWGPCEESLGCCWHCQAQSCLAPGRQPNCCKPQRRVSAHFNATSTRNGHKTCFLYKGAKGEAGRLLKFSPFLLTFLLVKLKYSFTSLGPWASTFSLKNYFCSKWSFLLFFCTISS